MKYDFDEIIDRRNTDSLKWDVKAGELPMWVADMDFRTAPEVCRALSERAAHGVFGYNVVPKAWNDAIVGHWKRRYGYEIPSERLIFCTGVVPAISSLVRKLTTPAEKVVLQTPAFNVFFNSVLNSGRTVLESPLRYDGTNYSIDFSDLEEKLSDPQTTLMILCNPHNPTGNIWTREELAKIGELCKKHHVTVISDEIHCDITEPDERYIPYASVSETCANGSLTCISASKAFNFAGLQTAAVYSHNEALFHKANRAFNTDEIAEPNTFAVTATIAAFNEGEEWLDEMRAYISQNKKLAREFIEKHLPKITVTPSKATYLLWLNISAYGKNAKELANEIRTKTGLYLSEGNQFGGNGKEFLRLNVAYPKSVLLDGLNRLKKALNG